MFKFRSFKKRFKKKIYHYIDKKDYVKALDLIERERLNQKNKLNQGFYYVIYGIVQIYIGNLYEARLFLKKGLDIGLDIGEEILGLKGLGYLDLRVGEVQKSLVSYQRVLELDIRDQVAKRVIHRINSRDLVFRNLLPNDYVKDSGFGWKKKWVLGFGSLVFLTLGLIFLDYRDRVSGLLFFADDQEGDFVEIKQKRYQKNIYLTLEEKIIKKESIKKKNFIDGFWKNRFNLKEYNSNVMNLNELLLSNIGIEEKIYIQHRYREYYIFDEDLVKDLVRDIEDIQIQMVWKEMLRFDLQNDMRRNPEKYNDVIIVLKGLIQKYKEGYKLYSLGSISLEVESIDSKDILLEDRLNQKIECLVRLKYKPEDDGSGNLKGLVLKLKVI